jgi:hypothetical protein
MLQCWCGDFCAARIAVQVPVVHEAREAVFAHVVASAVR